MKTKRNWKWKVSHTVLERRNLCFSSYKNRQWKVKPWWVGARGRKKRAFFVPFVLSEGNLFKIRVLSQCIMYWIHFQNIYTFTYQKTLLHTLLLLVSKIIKSLQCIPKVYEAINCLNKNLITHLVWYTENVKSYDIETFSINRVLDK